MPIQHADNCPATTGPAQTACTCHALAYALLVAIEATRPSTILWWRVVGGQFEDPLRDEPLEYCLPPQQNIGLLKHQVATRNIMWLWDQGYLEQNRSTSPNRLGYDRDTWAITALGRKALADRCPRGLRGATRYSCECCSPY